MVTCQVCNKCIEGGVVPPFGTFEVPLCLECLKKATGRYSKLGVLSDKVEVVLEVDYPCYTSALYTVKKLAGILKDSTHAKFKQVGSTFYTEKLTWIEQDLCTPWSTILPVLKEELVKVNDNHRQVVIVEKFAMPESRWANLATLINYWQVPFRATCGGNSPKCRYADEDVLYMKGVSAIDKFITHSEAGDAVYFSDDKVHLNIFKATIDQKEFEANMATALALVAFASQWEGHDPNTLYRDFIKFVKAKFPEVYIRFFLGWIKYSIEDCITI